MAHFWVLFVLSLFVQIQSQDIEIIDLSKIEVPEIPKSPHPDFIREWYDIALNYATEHYKEKTIEENEKFAKFTTFLDVYMHDYIKNMTKIDDLDIVEGSNLLRQMYENGTIGEAEMSAVYNMGAILQQIYVQRIVQIYDLAPSFFPNGTVETFCEIFEICKSPSLETTTVKVINESITNETLTTESSNSFTLQPDFDELGEESSSESTTSKVENSEESLIDNVSERNIKPKEDDLTETKSTTTTITPAQDRSDTLELDPNHLENTEVESKPVASTTSQNSANQIHMSLLTIAIFIGACFL